MDDLLKVVLAFCLFVAAMWFLHDQLSTKKLACVGPYCITESTR